MVTGDWGDKNGKTQRKEDVHRKDRILDQPYDGGNGFDLPKHGLQLAVEAVHELSTNVR